MTMRLQDERGAALIITLLATMLLTALGLALVLTTTTETMITANYRVAQEALYAADAGLERSIQDLLRVSSWNSVLAGATKSGFIDNGASVMPDGTQANIVALTTNLQADSDADYGASPNRPVWRLFAHAHLSDLLLTGTVTARDYVVVWVADDPAETDGDPLTETNGILMVRAEAFGEGGSHKVVEATVSRSFAATAERGYSGQRGLDEQNQRFRETGLGTPGTALTEMRMDLTTGGMVVQ